MGLFRKREDPGLEFTGPDGQVYAAIPQAQYEKWMEPVGQRIEEVVQDAMPDFIERAQQSSLLTVVRRERGSGETPTMVAASWAYTAAKHGYATRVAEFEALGESELAVRVTGFLARGEREGTFGTGWYAALNGTALLLSKHEREHPLRPDVAGLLAPVGFGPHAHKDIYQRTVTTLFNDFDAGPDTKRDTGGLTELELARCWLFGYHLRTCEIALPPDGAEALSSLP